jgi:Domain of unknown function (DUF4352)
MDMRISGLLVAVLLVGLAGCSSDPAQSSVLQYNMGEKVPVGHLTYTVFETQWATHFGEGVNARVPQNRFFLVRLSAVNGGVADATIPNFTIEDDSGHVYNELTDGDGVPQWVGYLRSAKPADFVQGNVVFDAPAGHYKLRVTDDQKHAALVDMPLTFGAETPDITPVGPADVTKGK